MKHKLHKKLVALQMIAVTSLLSLTQVFAMTGFDEITKAGSREQSVVNIKVVTDGSGEEDPVLFSAYLPETLPIKVIKTAMFTHQAMLLLLMVLLRKALRLQTFKQI